jgi:hypothetical protein
MALEMLSWSSMNKMDRSRRTLAGLPPSSAAEEPESVAMESW